MDETLRSGNFLTFNFYLNLTLGVKASHKSFYLAVQMFTYLGSGLPARR